MSFALDFSALHVLSLHETVPSVIKSRITAATAAAEVVGGGSQDRGCRIGAIEAGKLVPSPSHPGFRWLWEKGENFLMLLFFLSLFGAKVWGMTMRAKGRGGDKKGGIICWGTEVGIAVGNKVLKCQK